MKIDKYDRQVRIWGPKGQKKLSQSRIAVIGCSGSSIQAAKNLILPGIGRIDIIDDQKVSIQDLSSSFFYTTDSVGKFRGEEASKNLLQMNRDVEGHFLKLSVIQILNEANKYLKQYDLIICCNLKQQETEKLSQQCWRIGVPAIFGSSVGFFFHIRSQKQIHIVESQNTAGKKYYLRLHDPFQALKKYVQEKQLKKLIIQLKKNPQEIQTKQKLQKIYSKIPYPVFLIQAYLDLKHQHNRKPKSQEVKHLLQQWRSLVSEDPNIRSGINEALTRTFDLYQTYDNFMPDMEIFEDPNVKNANVQSQFVYIFLKAVKQFIKQHQNLPQIVRLPDINVSTKEYLHLKNIYKQEYEKNKHLILSIINNIAPEYQVDNQLLGDYINNIDALKIIKMRPYFQELKSPDTIGASLEYIPDLKSLFLALRTYKIFEKAYNKPPNPEDFEKIVQISRKLSSEWRLSQIDERFLKQVCRYKGKTLISYDSMAGAIVGQEAVKLLTNCFTPMNNGYFFDGLNCKGYTVTL